METENSHIPQWPNPFNNDDQMTFTEFYRVKPNQHWMTIRATSEGKLRVIGRISRTYDIQEKKMKYTAVDRTGRAVFEPTYNFYELKKQFIEHRKTLLLTIPENPIHRKDKELDELEKDRRADLNEIRNRNDDKQQEKGIGR